MRHPDGRTQSCELRDDSCVGTGWDVIVLENDEPLFSISGAKASIRASEDAQLMPQGKTLKQGVWTGRQG